MLIYSILKRKKYTQEYLYKLSFKLKRDTDFFQKKKENIPIIHSIISITHGDNDH